MANYEGIFRSSYFKVKDINAFRDWLATWTSQNEIKLFESLPQGAVAIACKDPIPTGRDLNDDWKEANFAAELQGHLAAGEVAVLQEVGSEGLRYVVGDVVVVTADGPIEYQNLGAVAETMAAKYTDQPIKMSY